MALSKRSIVEFLGILALVSAVGFGASNVAFPAVRSLLCDLSNWAFELPGLHVDTMVELTPAPPDMPRQAQDQVQTDTVLSISPEGQRSVRMGLSLRRDVYLPLVVFAALVLAAPLPFRRRAIGLVLGSALTVGVGVASVWVLVEFLIANQWPQFSEASDFSQFVFTFLFERWLTPPGNRVIAPLMLAALWVAANWQGLESNGQGAVFDAGSDEDSAAATEVSSQSASIT
jgi:hypothetical protein